MSSRPGKDREQVCCVAWCPPCAAADGAASTKVDARRHARAARCQSPAPPPAARPRGAMSIASPSATRPHGAISNRQPRSAQGSVHEGGRPAARPRGAMSIASPSAARPRGAISNRQPRSRRGGVHEGGRPAARPHGAMSIASPSPGGTPARRDFQSPALQRHARTARFPIASPSAARPHGTMSIASPAAHRAASTKVDARRHARAARFQSPALQRHARTARFQSPAPLLSHPPTTACHSGRGSVR